MQEKQRESVSLERDVAILNANIRKEQLGIRARNITIDGLVGEIGDKSDFVVALNKKTEREKASLSQLLRKTNEINNTSLVEIIFGNQNISDFFMDVDEFESIKQALNASFDEILSVKNATEAEVKDLEETKSEEVNLRVLQEAEKRKLTQNEAEKQRILIATKGEEDVYQKIIKAKEKTAAEIRSALFALRGSSAISFGKAYELAVHAEEQTGVRAAFLLGIITVNNNLNINIAEIEQFFLGDLPGEKEYVDYILNFLPANKLYVSYNGKAFDYYALKNRFLMHGRELLIKNQLDLLYIL